MMTRCGGAAQRIDAAHSPSLSSVGGQDARGYGVLRAQHLAARPGAHRYSDARSAGRSGSSWNASRPRSSYRELVDLSPNAILIHCDDRIVFANSATARLLGATQPSELSAGRSTTSYIPSHREFARARGVALIIEQRRALGTSEMK